MFHGHPHHQSVLHIFFESNPFFTLLSQRSIQTDRLQLSQLVAAFGVSLDDDDYDDGWVAESQSRR